MKRIFILFVFLFSFMVFSSELRVFTDGSIYYLKNPHKFICFNGSARVFCGEKELNTFIDLNSKSNSPLFKLYSNYVSVKNKLVYLKKKKEYFDKARDNFQLKSSNDFMNFLKYSGTFAKEYVNTENKINVLSVSLKNIVKLFKKGAPALSPYVAKIPNNCQNIRVEFLGISFYTRNKFTYYKDSKRADIEKDVVIVNRSGVDIKADKVYLLNFSSQRSFYPIDFSPWEIREGEYYAEKSVSTRMLAAAPMPRKRKGEMLAANASQIESRIYMLNNVSLESDGEEKSFKVKFKNLPVDLTLVCYPYRDFSVYREYSFTLPFEIDSNQWIVRAGKEVYKNVNGNFLKNKYRIFAGVDYSIKVERKPILKFNDEKGFFSKKTVKKDGYRLIVRNIGDKDKSVKIIDRIPVSTNKDVIVKLLGINGINDYKLTKNGKLEFKLKLKKGETKEVKVVFQIQYPDDKNIVY